MFLNTRNFGHVQSIYYTEMAKMYIMIMLIISIIYQKIKGKNGNLISGNYKKEKRNN